MAQALDAPTLAAETQPWHTCASCGRRAPAHEHFCTRCGRALAFVYRPLQPGERVRDYTVVRLLSRGGMGAVYLATDHGAFDRSVVIKQLLDYFDADDPRAAQAARERFRDEARTLARLRHPGIPQMYTCFSQDASNFMVMEYIEGSDLEQRLTRTERGGAVIRGAPVDPVTVARWGAGLCKVLEYLAAQQPHPVVHHDIKPANLVLDANSSEVRLVDFGTARVRLLPQPGGRVGVQKSSIYGTVGYAPPEQYGGASEPRSDVYALAATLYHLATDDDPRDEPFTFRRLAGLPPGLRAALAPALETDVRRRCTAGQLRAALEVAASTRREVAALAPAQRPAREQDPPAATPTPSNAPADTLPAPSTPPAAGTRTEPIATVTAHAGPVRALAWRPDGALLASGSGDGTVKLWGPRGEGYRSMAGHRAEVYCAAWSSAGDLLASGDADGALRLWTPRGAPRRTAAVGTSGITALGWRPAGELIAVATGDGAVCLWGADGAPRAAVGRHGERVLSLAWSPDGRALASGAADGTIRIWQIGGSKPRELSGHRSAVWALAWSPDGRVLASAAEDGAIRLWDHRGATRRTLEAHGAAVCALAWSPNGAMLASGGWDNRVALWRSGGRLAGWLEGHGGAVRCLAWHPEGQVLASGSWDATIRLWRPAQPLAAPTLLRNLVARFAPASKKAHDASGG